MKSQKKTNVKLKVLNLYAGIGGNRKLWKNVDVTAVEIDPKIAAIYKDYFPEDNLVIGDAHQYLLDHYKEFDFIWSSPPCPTHSRTNVYLNAQGVIRYPAVELWQEIIFLKHFFKGKYVVENVISYYEPLIKPQKCARHYFWSNFIITEKKFKKDFNLTNGRKTTRLSNSEWLKKLQELHGFDISGYDLKGIEHKEKLLTNCVLPKLGLHIFNCAFKTKQQTLTTQNTQEVQDK